jgi:ornithine carbamoyltransferase
VRSLLRTSDLSSDDIATLLDLSREIAAHPLARMDLLRGQIAVIYMDKPSTRTRLSFDAAIHRLGGDVAVVGPDELQIGRGETIEDTARVVSGYASCFIIRTFSDELVQRFSAAASIPVVNALTDVHHPCQSIADVFTLRERFGSLAGLPIAYVGDGNNNVAHSLIEAAALTGMHLTVAAPSGYEPDGGVLALSQEIAATTLASIRVTSDVHAAVAGAATIYTDTWFSMGVDERERDARVAVLAPYRVDDALMAAARPDAVFMHCLPAHRGEEVTASVIDGPRSIVFRQAQNRLHTEQAILIALLERHLTGRTAAIDLAAFGA